MDRRLQDFNEGEVLLREPPFVAGQHALNRSKAVVCANCFRFLGSVELQIAWHLLCDKYEGIVNMYEASSPLQQILSVMIIEERWAQCIASSNSQICWWI